MKLSKWLADSTSELNKLGILTARLDCLVLLSDETAKDKSWILAHPDYRLTTNVLKSLNNKITQRKTHIPLAYIRGKTEFYGREFIVNEHTLVPRPETESMITLLKNLLSKARPWKKIIDVGTGSGCLAVTAKLEIPEADVLACDIDNQCLSVTKLNAKKYNVQFELIHGDLLEPIYKLSTEDEVGIIVLANLPYVPEAYKINNEAGHEPQGAIFAGTDGLELYRKLFQQSQLLKSVTYLLTESMDFQHLQLQKIACAFGFEEVDQQGLIQLFERATD